MKPEKNDNLFQTVNDILDRAGTMKSVMVNYRSMGKRFKEDEDFMRMARNLMFEIGQVTARYLGRIGNTEEQLECYFKGESGESGHPEITGVTID